MKQIKQQTTYIKKFIGATRNKSILIIGDLKTLFLAKQIKWTNIKELNEIKMVNV